MGPAARTQYSCSRARVARASIGSSTRSISPTLHARLAWAGAAEQVRANCSASASQRYCSVQACSSKSSRSRRTSFVKIRLRKIATVTLSESWSAVLTKRPGSGHRRCRARGPAQREGHDLDPLPSDRTRAAGAADKAGSYNMTVIEAGHAVSPPLRAANRRSARAIARASSSTTR